MSQDEKDTGPYIKRTREERAALNEELGFYPAKLDDESVAEYRRVAARDREQIEGYRRMYGSPRSSHWNQFRHLAKGREPRV